MTSGICWISCRGGSYARADSLGVRELAWGFEESWKPGVVFSTRIESAVKPAWRDSMERRRCIIPILAFFETSHDETYISPKSGRTIKHNTNFGRPGNQATRESGYQAR